MSTLTNWFNHTFTQRQIRYMQFAKIGDFLSQDTIDDCFVAHGKELVQLEGIEKCFPDLVSDGILKGIAGFKARLVYEACKILAERVYKS